MLGVYIYIYIYMVKTTYIFLSKIETILLELNRSYMRLEQYIAIEINILFITLLNLFYIFF